MKNNFDNDILNEIENEVDGKANAFIQQLKSKPNLIPAEIEIISIHEGRRYEPTTRSKTGPILSVEILENGDDSSSGDDDFGEFGIRDFSAEFENAIGDRSPELIEKLLASLTKKQKYVMLGIMDGKTQEEIAKEVGVTQKAISKIFLAASAKLRKNPLAQELKIEITDHTDDRRYPARFEADHPKRGLRSSEDDIL